MNFEPLAENNPSGDLRGISRNRCLFAYVGKVYFACKKRPVNWGYGAISSRFDNERAFHPSLSAAKRFVEGNRVQGTSWEISEQACLVAANQSASVFTVEINADPPFGDWEVQYGSGQSPTSISESWNQFQEQSPLRVTGGGDIWPFIFVRRHENPEWRCLCGKRRGREHEGWECGWCGEPVAREVTAGGTYPKPCVRPLKTWTSSSVGSQYHLYWSETSGKQPDLRGAFKEAGRLTVHLG